MRKVLSIRGKFLHLLVAIVTFLLILFYVDGSTTQATLFLFWGTFVLIDQMWILYCEKDIYVEFIIFTIASYLLVMFLIWLGNTILKSFNGMFYLFEWEFRIGNLFPDPYHFLFSIPGLLCALILATVGYKWEGFGHYKLFKFLLIYFPELMYEFIKEKTRAHEKAI